MSRDQVNLLAFMGFNPKLRPFVNFFTIWTFNFGWKHFFCRSVPSVGLVMSKVEMLSLTTSSATFQYVQLTAYHSAKSSIRLSHSVAAPVCSNLWPDSRNVFLLTCKNFEDNRNCANIFIEQSLSYSIFLYFQAIQTSVAPTISVMPQHPMSWAKLVS